MSTHAPSAETVRFTEISSPSSLGHQREGPYRAASRDFLPDDARDDTAAQAGDNSYVLHAFVRVRNRRGIDARARLELPECLPGILIERDELARWPPCEEETTAGRKHARGAG